MLAAAAVASGALVVPLGGASSAAVGVTGMTNLIPSADAGTDAVAMLEAAYTKSRAGTYHGIQLVMVDNQTHYVGVSHVPGHTYLYAASSNGSASKVYETVDPAAAGSSADPLSKDPLALLKAHFRLTFVRTDELLGRPARVIEALAPDGRVAAAFWVDEGSSLLVRRDTYDSRQNVYSQVKYIQLDIDAADPSVRVVAATTLRPDGREEDAQRLDQLRSRGWWAQPELPGGLSLYDAREVSSGSATVLHLSYSDGISTVSVFEQHGRLAGASRGQLPAGWTSVVMPDGRRVVQADGAPLRAAWQAKNLVVAVIADVPPGSVSAVVGALPYGSMPARHGMVVGRLTRGLSRIGSMLDPFS
jgi:negative regulator of sigma E activity